MASIYDLTAGELREDFKSRSFSEAALYLRSLAQLQGPARQAAFELLGQNIFARQAPEIFAIDPLTCSDEMLPGLMECVVTALRQQVRFSNDVRCNFNIRPSLIPGGAEYDCVGPLGVGGLLDRLERNWEKKKWPSRQLAAYVLLLVYTEQRERLAAAYERLTTNSFAGIAPQVAFGLALVIETVLAGSQRTRTLLGHVRGLERARVVPAHRLAAIDGVRVALAPMTETYEIPCVAARTVTMVPMPYTIPGCSILENVRIREVTEDYHFVIDDSTIVRDASMTDFDVVLPDSILALAEGDLNSTAHLHIRMPIYDSVVVDYAASAETVTEAVVPLEIPGSRNFGHWHSGVVPRVLAARQYLGRNVKFALRRRPLPWQMEQLALLGVGERDLRLVLGRGDAVYTNATFVLASAYSMPSVSTVAGMRALPTYRQFPPIAGKRVYLSRSSGNSWRRILNEHQLLPLLAQRGFEVIYPDRLSMYDQISVFQNATHIISSSAAFSNAIHCAPGTRALEIDPINLAGGPHLGVMRHLGIEAMALWSVPVPAFGVYDPRYQADQYVDPADLDLALTLMGC